MKVKTLLFTILSFILLTINLGSWGLTETSEARYAEISKEMFESNDYLHPKLLDIHHYHKPPLTYYITTLGYKLFGVNEFGARFFLQIAIILQMILIFSITNLLFKDQKIALSAMLIYFSIPVVLISSRNLTTDAYLNTFVLASVYFWLKYKLKGLKKINLYLFFIALGLCFEIKGPVGWVFPVLFIINYKIVLKEKLKFNLHVFLGLILCLGISFLWYAIVCIENPLLWDYFIKNQVLNRIASKSFNRAKPFWFYFVTIPAIGLPWIWFLIHQIFLKFKRIKTKKSVNYILLLTILCIFIVFSLFKTKLILYVLPMFGFVAVLMAKVLSKLSPKTLKVYNIIIISVTALFIIALISINVVDDRFIFNQSTAIFIVLIFIILILGIYKKQIPNLFLRTSYLGYIFGCIVLFSGTLFMKQNQSNVNSTKEVFSFIHSEIKDVKNIVVFNYLLPSAKFYSNKNIITLNNGHNTVQRETQFENNTNWKPYNLDLKKEDEKDEALKAIKNHAVILARKRDKILDYIIKGFDSQTHKKVLGKWVIYY